MFEIQLLEVLFFKQVNVKKKLKPHMFLKKNKQKNSDVWGNDSPQA